MLNPDQENTAWQWAGKAGLTVNVLWGFFTAWIDNSWRFLVRFDKHIPHGLALISVHLHPGQRYPANFSHTLSYSRGIIRDFSCPHKIYISFWQGLLSSWDFTVQHVNGWFIRVRGGDFLVDKMPGDIVDNHRLFLCVHRSLIYNSSCSVALQL